MEATESVVTKEHMYALERAWVIIANAGGSSDWAESQTPEWIAAAERFRDEVWHPTLARYLAVSDPREVELQ